MREKINFITGLYTKFAFKKKRENHFMFPVRKVEIKNGFVLTLSYPTHGQNNRLEQIKQFKKKKLQTNTPH